MPLRQRKCRLGQRPLRVGLNLDAIRAGRITIHPGIERFTEKGVVFTDGTVMTEPSSQQVLDHLVAMGSR